VDPKKSAQATPGFAWQAVGIRLDRGSLDRRHWGGRRELTAIRLAGWAARAVMNWQRMRRWSPTCAGCPACVSGGTHQLTLAACVPQNPHGSCHVRTSSRDRSLSVPSGLPVCAWTVEP